MTKDSWLEVKRLAADLQRAQLGETIQRLTDRNCIEVVNKLVQLKLLTLTHTCDGKAYLTDLEIVKEIREELAMRGGRASLNELQTAINVDYSYIESHVIEIARSDSTMHLILGQLIDANYCEKICEGIDEALVDKGQITLSELTRYYDLPSTFIREIMERHKKDRSDLVLEGDVLYTDKFIRYHKRAARGALSALTRPKTVSNVMDRYELQGNLFSRVIAEFSSSQDLPGLVSGSEGKSLYKPSIYARTQTSWVMSYFKDNGYLEYDLIRRLGISDPKQYIRKLPLGESVVLLKKCAVNKSLQEQVNVVIDDAVKSSGWMDIQQYLPSNINKDDAAEVIEAAIVSRKDAVCFKSVVVSNAFMKKCRDFLAEKMDARARIEVKEFRSHPVEMFESLQGASSREPEPETGKKKKGKAGGGSGAGSQGREVKTKSTKNKYRAADRAVSDNHEDVNPGKALIFMDTEEMENVLAEEYPNVPDEAMPHLVAAILPSLNKQYRELVGEMISRPSGTSSSEDWKKKQTVLEDKMNTVFTNIKLFLKGIKLFPDDAQGVLNKHLLNTLCSEVSDVIFKNADTNSAIDADNLTSEKRLKVLSSVSDKNLRERLTKVHQSLTTDVEAFCDAVEDVCGADCMGIHIKKLDKKRERQIVHSHRMSLLEQFENESDPMLGLHLCAVVLFVTSTGVILHAPGKCVPNIISYLSEKLDEAQQELLAEYQKDVVKQVKTPSDELIGSLKERLPALKELVKNFKKSS